MQHSNKINRSGRFIMDLSQVIEQKLSLSKRFGWLVSGLLLTACSTVPHPPQAQISDVTPEVETEQIVEEVPSLPLTAELTYLVLTAEVAKQRGDIFGAADLYQRAAETIDSPNLASRSTQIANLTRDGQRIDKALNRWSEVDPDDANIYFLKVPFLLIQGNYNDVPSAVNKALELEPEKASFFLERLTENMGKLANAEPALQIMSQLDVVQQQQPEALYQYARLAAHYLQNDLALSTLDQVLQAQPGHEGALILKAKMWQQAGQGEEAIALLKPAAAKKDASVELRFTYGQLLGENNHIDDAKAVFESLYETHPYEPDIIFALGIIAIQERELEDARILFNRLLTVGDPKQQATYFLGITEKEAGNITEALAWFDAVPQHNARYQAAQTHYVSLLADHGALPKARLHLAQLRTENPDLAVQYYLFESTLLRERHQPQLAYDLLSDALTAHPDDIDLRYGRAMVAETLDRIDLLEDDLRYILALKPDHAQTLNALGYTLTDRTDRHQEALELINQALAIAPNDPFYLDSLGWAYYRMGDLDKASQYLQQAVDLQNDPEFLAHLGEVIWQQGHQRKAKKVWQQGLDLDENNTLLRDTMKRFGL